MFFFAFTAVLCVPESACVSATATIFMFKCAWINPDIIPMCRDNRAYILQLPGLLVTVNGAHAQAQARALVLADCGLVHAASLTEYVTLTPL